MRHHPPHECNHLHAGMHRPHQHGPTYESSQVMRCLPNHVLLPPRAKEHLPEQRAPCSAELARATQKTCHIASEHEIRIPGCGAQMLSFLSSVTGH